MRLLRKEFPREHYYYINNSFFALTRLGDFAMQKFPWSINFDFYYIKSKYFI